MGRQEPRAGPLVSGAYDTQHRGAGTVRSLGDRVAVVTGAGSGIGRATAELLARRGCDLALVDRDPDSLRATSDLVSAAGRPCLDAIPIPAHTNEMGHFKAAFDSGEGKLPPIEVYKVGEVYFVVDGNHRVSVALFTWRPCESVTTNFIVVAVSSHSGWGFSGSVTSRAI